MQTEITELLGIQYPIIQGGMAWVAEHHLAAAVSEAGGLGLIGAANAPAEWVREQIRAVMRWAGPRMLPVHPVLSIKHVIVTMKARREANAEK